MFLGFFFFFFPSAQKLQCPHSGRDGAHAHAPRTSVFTPNISVLVVKWSCSRVSFSVKASDFSFSMSWTHIRAHRDEHVTRSFNDRPNARSHPGPDTHSD